MKLRLPGPARVKASAQRVVERPLLRGLSASSVCQAPSEPSINLMRAVDALLEGPSQRKEIHLEWEHDFSVEKPGSLGPYVVAKPYVERGGLTRGAFESKGQGIGTKKAPEVHRGRGRRSLLEQARDVRPGAEAAVALLEGFEGSPAAYFLGRPYSSKTLGNYLGASCAIRGEAIRPGKGRPTWGKYGWTRDENELLLILIGELRDMIRDSHGRIDLALEGLEDRNQRRLYEGAYRAGVAAGELGFEMGTPDRPYLTRRPILWGDEPMADMGWAHRYGIHSALLAMRIFTAEQVAYLCPRRSLDGVQRSLSSWLDQGLIRRHECEYPLPVYRLTERGAETVIKDGLVSPEEAEKRLIVRRGQEVHDLAVGDAVIMASMEVQEGGGEILEVVNEMRLIAEGNSAGASGVAYPDFKLAFQVGSGVHRELSFEVMGLGNQYRTTAKLGKVKQNGFQMVNPGFDGRGFRYV